MNGVFQVGEDQYIVDTPILNSLEQLDRIHYQGGIYGVSDKDLMGASIEYYAEGHKDVPQIMVDKRTVFRKIRLPEYGKDKDILEVVKDVREAILALDRYLRKRRKNYGF